MNLSALATLQKERHLRTLRYKTPELLQAKIDAYFEFCEMGEERKITKSKKGEDAEVEIIHLKRPPTLSGLILFLGFSHRASLNVYLSRDGFFEVMQAGILRIQAYLEERLVVSKTPQGVLALLQTQFGYMTAYDRARIDLKNREVESRMLHLKEMTEANLALIRSKRANQVSQASVHTQRAQDLAQRATVNVNINNQIPTGEAGLSGYPPKPQSMEEWQEWYFKTYNISPPEKKAIDITPTVTTKAKDNLDEEVEPSSD